MVKYGQLQHKTAKCSYKWSSMVNCSIKLLNAHINGQAWSIVT